MTTTWDGLPPPEWRDKDGWHWLETPHSDAVPFLWFRRKWETKVYPGIPSSGCWQAHECRYLGPCLPPAEIAALREEVTYLRAAIEDEQIVCEIPPLPMHDYASARAAIQNAIRWNTDVALNPAVSEDARKLQGQARAEALREAVEIALAHKGDAARRRRNIGFLLHELSEEARAEVCAEERGEDIAAEMIAAAVRALIEKEQTDVTE